MTRRLLYISAALVIALTIGITAVLATIAHAQPLWRPSDRPYTFSFPRDHASHPAYATEWWYYTGHLTAEDRRFGFQLTFFRVGIDPRRAATPSAWAPHTFFFAHAALTDESARRFRFDEKIARPALGMAGADSVHYRVWVDDWSAELQPDGRRHRLTASADGFRLQLDLEPLKPPVIHGIDGVSRKSAGSGHASHYYSLTRMRAEGRISAGGDSLEVRGEAWMDHEFMTSSLAPGQVGWDWFSIQLEDGRDLMVYRLRLQDGSTDSASSGTLVERDGSARYLPLSAWSLIEHATWTSPATGGRYPARWTLRLPESAIDLHIEPTLPNQELVTRNTVGVNYWEGSARVEGTERGKPIRGYGYVELTGYSGVPPGR